MPSLKVVTQSEEPEGAQDSSAQELRLLEAMLFACSEPLDEKSLAAQLPQGTDVHTALIDLQREYASRGVTTSKGSVDVLLETGWIRPRGRRKSPGRPVTYGTTEAFLSHFGLDALGDLPGLEELRGSGLLDGRLPPGFSVPMPSDDPALREDEDALEPADLDLGLAPPPERSGQD